MIDSRSKSTNISENIFHSFFRTASFPLCIFNEGGFAIFFNDRFSELFGLEAGDAATIEFLVEKCRSEEHEQGVEDYWNKILTRLQTGSPAPGPLEVIVNNGEEEALVLEISHDIQGEYILFSFFDVTERNKVRDLLFHEKEFNRAILESMDDAVVACDENGILALFNRKARLWHGMDSLAISQQDWATSFDLYGEDGATLLKPETVPLSRAFAGETVKNVAFSIKASDQPLRQIIASGGPFYDENQKKQGAVIVMHDVSDRLKKEQILKENEELYRKLISTLPDVIIETDMYGNILLVNEQIVTLGFAGSEKELIGKNVFSLISAEDRERALKNFISMPEKSIGPVEYHVKFEGKPKLICDVNGNLLRDEAGTPYGMVFIIRDLTEKKKAGEQIRMLAHTIRSVSECISITDTSDRIIFLNDAFLKTYGFTEEEILGKTMEVVRSPNNDPNIVNSILSKTQSGGWQGEIMNCRKGGFEFPIQLSTSAVRDENGKIICLVGVSKDISEKKEAERLMKLAEDELRASRKAFQNYFDNTTVGLCVTSSEKGWIEVNTRLCQMIGYSREELALLTWAELTHPDDLAVDLNLFHQLLDGSRDTYEIDKRFIRKDGSIVYTTLYAAAERNPDGSIHYINASLVDITSRKIAEDAIIQSEKKFREIANLLPVAIFETDLTGNLEFANQAGKDWLGYTDEDLNQGLNILSALDATDRIRAMENFQKIITLQYVSSGEYRLLRKNGSSFDALITSRGIEENGQVVGFRGVINDITDQKKAEELRIAHEAAEALIKAQRHLSLLVGQSLVGFIELNTKMEILAWNPSAERIFGFTAKEAIGKKMTRLIMAPTNRNRVKKNLEEVLKNKSGYKNINQNITKDGRVITCEWHDTALIDTDGQVISIVSLVADISERIKAEEALKESREKLKQFAAHLQEAIEEERIQISRDLHDSLGQSLTGLKMYASRLQTGILKQKGTEMTGLANQVEEMIAVINSLMQLIRKIAKRLRPEILDEMGLIAALESQLEEFKIQSGINYTLENQLEKIPMEPKHRIEVFRIFQEVLTNVIRHSKATMVRVSISVNQLSSQIVVEDNGIGIPEIDIWKMKTLGLLGMKERAAVFGGTLNILGTKGKGTKVTIEIPVFKKHS